MQKKTQIFVVLDIFLKIDTVSIRDTRKNSGKRIEMYIENPIYLST